MACWNGPFIAVDWGTTNRRAYAVSADGLVTAGLEDSRGLLSVRPEEFASAVVDVRERLGRLPMLLAGMVGARSGWAEVPYVTAPAGLAGLARGVHMVADDIAIVPGVSVSGNRPGVMRGEEVQVLGAVSAGLVAPDAAVCQPGTHTKWITMADGQIADFRTSMTGEIFALIKNHSILAAHLRGEVAANAGFLEGVDMALSGEPVLDALFGVRSRMLLGALDASLSSAYTSGILIGTDVAAHASRGDSVALLGRPDLCVLYAAALERAGCVATSTDGAAAFVAGMSAIRKLLP